DSVKRGEWCGGTMPFGTNAVCFSRDGIERWRMLARGRNIRVKLAPDGTQTRYEEKGQHPKKESNEIISLRPSLIKSELEAVRYCFRTFAESTVSYKELARRLNSSGVKPYYSDQFKSEDVRAMLRNEIYVGNYIRNR